MKKLNVLHISPDFNYTCGVSKYISLIFAELIKYDNINLFFITNGGDSLQRITSLGIEPHIINFSKGIKNLKYFFRNIIELKNFCKEKSIDIIHTHHRYPELISNLIKKDLNVKTVTTVHSIVHGYKCLSFKSDIVMAVSKTVKENLTTNFGVNPSKVVQIYNPVAKNLVPLEKKEIRQKFGLNDNEVVILFVGRFTKEKGVYLLLNAFNMISDENINLKLFVITDREKSELKLENDVYFFPVSNNIEEYYTLSDAVIMPSLIESFPYVMLEAGLYKKVFIGAEVGGIKEFITDGLNGLLFKPNSEEEIVRIIKVFLSMNNTEKEKLSMNLHKKVTSLYDVESYVETLINIYNSLIQK